MKRIYSLTALGTLLYAMPANACMLLGILPYYDPTPIILLPIALFLAIQALFLRYARRELSYPKALLMACVGYAPSVLIGSIPFAWEIIDNLRLIYLLPIIDFTLATITISLIFRYPSRKILSPIVAGTVAFYFIVIIWLSFDAPGIRLPTAPY